MTKAALAIFATGTMAIDSLSLYWADTKEEAFQKMVEDCGNYLDDGVCFLGTPVDVHCIEVSLSKESQQEQRMYYDWYTRQSDIHNAFHKKIITLEQRDEKLAELGPEPDRKEIQYQYHDPYDDE